MSEKSKTAIIGLGYVGLPLMIDFCEAGLPVLGFDIDKIKVDNLNRGKSYISYISNNTISRCLTGNKFEATAEFNRLNEADSIIIAVPTPLDEHREPDLGFVKSTAETIAANLKKGQLVILESTTYPGTTREIILPALERTGLKVGSDYYLAYSPERVDPNNKNFSARQIPKVIGGITDNCLEKIKTLYSEVFTQVVPVSSVEAAEASKLLENIFRSVNIALVNEMKMLFDRMGINIWEVISASSTKPFGFMPFYPGPGLGGHCIPIDPFYLTWKAREYDFSTRFIELAGEINSAMPYFVIDKVIEALNDKEISVKGARILMLGAAYKKDVDDIRESPAVKIIDLLLSRGAEVNYHDPYIPVIKDMRRYPELHMESLPLNPQELAAMDCVLIITDHSCFDYESILKHSSLVVDTRNALDNYSSDKVIRA